MHCGEHINPFRRDLFWAVGATLSLSFFLQRFNGRKSIASLRGGIPLDNRYGIHLDSPPYLLSA